MKRFAFDRQAAMQVAWDLLWASNLKQREEGGYRPSTTYYLTASDLMHQVRRFAEETAEGKAWGSTGRAYGGGYGSRVRLSGNLLSDCRSWLHRNSQLTSHNFGSRSCTGERYRPVGEPISEAERGTLEEKEKRAAKPRPVHMRKRTGEYSSSFFCAPARKKGWGQPRSQAHVSMKAEDVTCPRCLKLMKEAA